MKIKLSKRLKNCNGAGEFTLKGIKERVNNNVFISEILVCFVLVNRWLCVGGTIRRIIALE